MPPHATSNPIRQTSICSFFLLPTFFFSWSGHHRDLHSFPTRRSSDQTHALPHRNVAAENAEDGVLRHADDVLERLARSEEHTSELQSRRDLVCRLLLEKKNKHPTQVG